jgi:hypothetical protein
MKDRRDTFPSSRALRNPWRRSPALRWPLAVLCLGLVAKARAQAAEMEIDVRTKIVDKEHIWTSKNKAAPGTGGHGKIYGILAVKEIKADWKLVKPVDETMILQVLSAEMNKNGFKLYAPGTKPEIVISVSYGRGEVENPYFQHGGAEGESGGDNRAGIFLKAPGYAGGVPNDSGAPTSVILGAFSQQLLDEKGFGYEANLQKAATEKLYIRVVAWAYPSGPKAKAKQLWKTTIVVDDPDHRDLNVVAAKMLEVGAPYFDRELPKPEVAVFRPVPDGRVNVGTPEVVSPRK